MSKLDITERLTFLAEKFDVFETEKVKTTDEAIKDANTIAADTVEDGDVDRLMEVAMDSIVTEQKTVDLKVDGWKVQEIVGKMNSVIGILSTKSNKRGFPIKKVSIHYDVFTAMVGADPTPNKICLQWMLNTFVRLLKNSEWEEARRFYSEDLPQANEYLTLFEGNKRKKKFKVMAQYSLKDFKDITNINEYKNLGQLFDAVDPFIERDPSEIEGIMKRYVDMGQAHIPFRDRRYTVYVPLTTDACTIFNNFASWCTVRTNNGMFDSYTSGHKKPNGKDSTLYIVMDNGFFTGDNEDIYHIHFETKQMRDRSNGPNVDLYGLILNNSEGITNYFGSELMGMAKDFKGSMNKNHYIDVLIDFGFTEALFDFFDDETTVILIDAQTSNYRRRVPKVPDVSRFKSVTHFVILDSSLHELHSSIGSLKTLKNLTLAGNKIEVLPSEIGQLSNLLFLNLWDNPIATIPEEIKYLDKSMGGKLDKIVINEDKISEVNYQKLKKLLPSVEF
jgi:hypothetical protein